MGKNKTYKPKPVDTSGIKLPGEVDRLRDKLAKNTHEVWAQARFKEGWTYGEKEKKSLFKCCKAKTEKASADGEAERDEKKNNLLKPYEDMNKKERKPDIDTVTETIKFIYANGYKIRPIDGEPKNWDEAETRNYLSLYTDEKGDAVKPPLYRAPMVVGLIAQDDAVSIDENGIKASFKEFFAYLCDKLGENAVNHNNDKRKTPIYILTKLGNDIEKKLAAYASKKYGVGILTAESDEYMIDHCCMLLALWDGVSVTSGTGAVVRRALLESENNTQLENFDIHDVCPVFQIILPSDELKTADRKKADDLRYNIRPLYPYVLEWGEKWYCIDSLTDPKVSVSAGKYAMIRTGKSEELKQAERFNKKLIRVYTKDQKKARREKFRDIRKKMSGSMARYEREDATKKMNKSIEEFSYRVRYNERITSEKFKSETLEGIFKKIRSANRYIASDICKSGGSYYSQTGDMRGKKRSVDAVNVRFMRIDSIATALEEKDKRLLVLISIFAGAAFVGYGLFSDFADPHSSLGVIGALVTTVAIICAISAFFISKIKGYHAEHTDLRLLGEILRTKISLNASDLDDRDVGEYFSERQKMNVVWARIVCRGWDAIDKAEGIYDAAGAQDIELRGVFESWIGTNDEVKNEKAADADKNGKYNPSEKGQLEYVRRKGKRYEKLAAGRDRIENRVSPIVALAMIAISLGVSYLFFRSGGNILKAGIDSQFTSGSLWSWAEAALIFVIGVVPAAVTCRFLYCSTRRYSETVKRFKWLALKYQKLIRCFEKAKDDDERREVIEEAARVSIEEISEWTELTSQSDANLPF